MCCAQRRERENKSCRQSLRFANWPTLKQTRQSCKRIGASSNAGFPPAAPPILSQLLWPDRSSIKRALTSNVKSASWPRTVGRTDGRLGSVVSYDEDVRKLIHQTVQIRCSVHLSQARGGGGVLTGALAMSSMSANMTDGCDCGRRRGRVRVQAVQS